MITDTCTGLGKYTTMSFHKQNMRKLSTYVDTMLTALRLIKVPHGSIQLIHYDKPCN